MQLAPIEVTRAGEPVFSSKKETSIIDPGDSIRGGVRAQEVMK